MTGKEKLEAFRQFAWDTDERWLSYLKSVEITSNDPAIMLRAKARWYKKTQDSDFDPEWVKDMASKPQPTTTTSSGTPPPPRSQPAATGTGTTGQSYTPPPPRSAQPIGSPEQQHKLFFMHVVVGWALNKMGRGKAGGPRGRARLSVGSGGQAEDAAEPDFCAEDAVVMTYVELVLLAVFHLLPVLPFLSSRAAYRWFMQITMLSSAYKVYLRHGPPKIWPWNWAALQTWLMYAVPSNDFFYTVVGMSFMAQHPIQIMMAPVLVNTLYAILQHGSTYFSHTAVWQRVGQRAHTVMMSKQRESQQTVALMEVLVGLLLLFQLVTPARSFLLLMFYWNMLKMRYHAPESAALHQQAWALVNARTAPYLARVPIAQRLLGYVQRWFLTLR